FAFPILPVSAIMSGVNLSNGGPLKSKPGAPAELNRLRNCCLAVLTLILLAFSSASHCQSTNSLPTGPKPLDASREQKQLVGVYFDEDSKRSFVLLERDGKLHWRDEKGREWNFDILTDEVAFIPSEGENDFGHTIGRDQNGNVRAFCYLNSCYTRTDLGPDAQTSLASQQSIEQLRHAALAATPPREERAFRKPDLVELAKLDPAIHLDVRYATAHDFLGVPVYTQARAFLQRPAAEALLRALRKLQPLGYGLLIHDGYRPWYVTKIFWDATPPEGKIFVADPAQGSRHNRGCAVDLTLYDLKTDAPIQMPGLYDEMSPRSFPNYPGGTSLQRWHRDLLRHAMESEGFTVYEAEWWHFDYKDWHEYGILNIPFEKLGIGSAEK